MYIIGVDPGSNKVGIGIIEFDENIELISYETIAINLEKSVVKHTFFRPIQTKMLALAKEFKHIIDKYEPEFVLFESGFVFNKRPGSIIPLSKALGVMETLLIDREKPIKSSLISPRRVKKLFTGNGKADKDEMEAKVKYIYGDMNVTEDEYDALGICTVLFMSIRKSPSILMVRDNI